MSTVDHLSVGDFAPSFPLPAPLSVSDIAGRPLVVFFFDPTRPGIEALLAGFREQWLHFVEQGANVVGVRCATPATGAATALPDAERPFPIADDVNQTAGRAFGVYGDHGLPAQACASFLIGPNLKIRRIVRDDGTTLAGHAARIVAELTDLGASDTPLQMTRHAPVLLIDDVFDRPFCRQLIETWQTQGNDDSGFMRQIGGRTVGVLDYGHKRRRDHFLGSGPMKERIKQLVGHRIVPEIRRAVHFEVTRFEDFRIVCYDARVGGYFRPHRDNTTDGTAHRRFAMTVNLNTEEYEGGALRFPEFGPHLYRPATGQAVIFSCSLLHEVTDVTAGRRFALLSFFYGEREARLREQYAYRTAGAEV